MGSPQPAHQPRRVLHGSSFQDGYQSPPRPGPKGSPFAIVGLLDTNDSAQRSPGDGDGDWVKSGNDDHRASFAPSWYDTFYPRRALAWYQALPFGWRLLLSFVLACVVGAGLAFGIHALPVVAFSWVAYAVSASMLSLALWSGFWLPNTSDVQTTTQSRWVWVALCLVSVAMLVLNVMCPLTLPSTAGAILPSMADAAVHVKATFVASAAVFYGLLAGLTALWFAWKAKQCPQTSEATPLRAHFLKGMAWGLVLIAAAMPVLVLCSILGAHPILKIAYDVLNSALTPGGFIAVAFVATPLVMGALCGGIRMLCGWVGRQWYAGQQGLQDWLVWPASTSGMTHSPAGVPKTSREPSPAPDGGKKGHFDSLTETAGVHDRVSAGDSFAQIFS